MSALTSTKKPWYKSKTVWFNIVTVGGAVATGTVGLLPTVQFLFTPQVYAITFAVVGVANIFLRSISDGSIWFTDKDSS